MVESLNELNVMGKPQSVHELKERLDSYFTFCADHDFRCGIETMCLSLSVSRQMFWRWCKADGCSEEWAEVCQNARQFVLGFLEQLTLKGRINPASSIFYLKNWADYKDAISFDDAVPATITKAVQTPEQIAARYGAVIAEHESEGDYSLPTLILPED